MSHSHSERIETLVFSANSKHLLSVCKERTTLWKVHGSIVAPVLSIPSSGEENSDGSKVRPVACVDNIGENIVVYRGNFFFTLYEIKDKTAVKKDVIDLTKEIRACGNPGFELDQYDSVSEIRFLAAESSHLRVVFHKGNESFFIDVQLFDCVPQMRKAAKYEDKSVFQLTVAGQANAKLLQDNLEKCISEA